MGANDAKRELRRRMRVVRLAAADPDRSAAIAARLVRLVEAADATVVMVYAAVPGEPDVESFAEWCRGRNLVVVAPDSHPAASVPIDPVTVDVVVVPGLAFTRDGRRLGQGGGWYDRLLRAVRADCLTVGVGFDEQVVDAVPTEPHDVGLQLVVTPTAVHGIRNFTKN